LTDNNYKSVLILGAGGHAKVITDTLISMRRSIVGILDPGKAIGETVLGIPVLGSDNKILEFPQDEIELANGIGALPGDTLRWELAKKFNGKGYRFATIIHPTAVISSNVKLAEGVQLMAGCIVQPDVVIGRDTIINTGSSIDHDCHIGGCCHIAPGVTLSGGVTLEDGVHVGTGACVVHQVTVGAGAVIGAGGTVHSDILCGEKYIKK